MNVCLPNFLCPLALRHLSKRYKTLAIFLVDIHLFLIACFFSYILWKFDVFSSVLIFANRVFWLISSVLTFLKFVKFLLRGTDRRGRYLLFSSPICLIYAKIWMNLSQYMLINVMLNHWFNKKRVQLHSLQTQTILLVNYLSLLSH